MKFQLFPTVLNYGIIASQVLGIASLLAKRRRQGLNDQTFVQRERLRRKMLDASSPVGSIREVKRTKTDEATLVVETIYRRLVKR